MPEPIILTETDEYFVIDKPAGYSVEPHTRFPSISGWIETHYGLKPISGSEPISGGLPTAIMNSADNAEWTGIVHRLDVETSGVMIWAKNPAAQEKLKLLWQGRQTEKTYLALVVGETPETGEIDLAITRDNKNDKQKVVMLNDGSGRPAITRYKQLEVGEWNGQKVSLVEAHPVTGRTHQIRIHFKAIGHPLVGDKLYGEKSTEHIAAAIGLTRHFLHAIKLCLPSGDKQVCYTAELPSDLSEGLTKLAIPLAKLA